eukprot:12286805-Heterocapsa_arctica.AAC.1
MSASSSFALANVPSRPNWSPLCLCFCYILAVVVHFCGNPELLVDLFIRALTLVPQYSTLAAPRMWLRMWQPVFFG